MPSTRPPRLKVLELVSKAIHDVCCDRAVTTVAKGIPGAADGLEFTAGERELEDLHRRLLTRMAKDELFRRTCRAYERLLPRVVHSFVSSLPDRHAAALIADVEHACRLAMAGTPPPRLDARIAGLLMEELTKQGKACRYFSC
jgi:hypothetical protein